MNRSRASWKKIIIGIVVGILAIAAFGFGVHLIEKHGLEDVQFGDTGSWGDDDTEPVELELDNELYVSQDNVSTYLMMGLDAGGVDQGEMYSGELADFLTLMVVDNTTKRFGFIQIDRNSMVPMEIPDENGNFAMMATQQICLSHWYGRTPEERNEYAVKAVSTLMGGLNIDGYYTINMEDIGAVNHAIGGVEIEFDTDMTEIDPAFKKGTTVRLTDKQAEKFIRARQGLDDETNAARMSRQTQYMQKVYNLVMNQIRENPEYISDLYQELEGKIETEGEARDLSKIANKMVQYDSLGIMKLSGTTKVADTLGDGKEHEEFYVNETSILTCLKKVIDLAKAPDDYYDKQDAENGEDTDADTDPDADSSDGQEADDADGADTDDDAEAADGDGYDTPTKGSVDNIQVIENE